MLLSETCWLSWGVRAEGGLYCESKYCGKKSDLVFSTIPSQAPWAMCIHLIGCVLTGWPWASKPVWPWQHLEPCWVQEGTLDIALERKERDLVQVVFPTLSPSL